jgi:hypothetical protein
MVMIDGATRKACPLPGEALAKLEAMKLRERIDDGV